MSVNPSPADFKRQDIVSTVTSILEAGGLAPEYLELVITEGMVMSGVESVTATLNELRELRCDEAQGYYFSRPVPAEELATLLRAKVAESRE
jgi:EAL domain-containing protein (putative c-di-GMP-specific phosphodiesterase class I)